MGVGSTCEIIFVLEGSVQTEPNKGTDIWLSRKLLHGCHTSNPTRIPLPGLTPGGQCEDCQVLSETSADRRNVLQRPWA